MADVRPRRSMLYAPASNEKVIAKARSLACDVVILDLEDSVAPGQKEAAREAAVKAIGEGGFGDRELMVRCNGLNTPWGEADIARLAAAGPAAILVPKINCGLDVQRYDALLGASSGTKLWAMIETTRAVFNLMDIASQSASTRLSGWVMGTNDLAKEMGAELDVDRAPFTGFLAQAVAAARSHGIVIADGVFNDIDDVAGFERQCAEARRFGFDGKSLIHPSQIAPCNAAFTPSDDALRFAQDVVSAFELPENDDKGAIRVAGRMVERLHLEQARDVIAIRAMIGQAVSA